MSYQATKLPSGRWGIFAGTRLLATIGSEQTLNMILAQLPKAKAFIGKAAEREMA